MNAYCKAAPGHPFHGPYHDREYGFPRRKDHELFERLILEINQAGLSWLTILQKRKGFRAAYRDFDPAVVARFSAPDKRRLMADAGIIRNRLKIDAAIHNARVVLHAFGGPEGFEVVREPLPEPRTGQVRVRTLAASVQFTDVILRKGQYPDLKDKPPLTLGYDTVGVVEAQTHPLRPLRERTARVGRPATHRSIPVKM